MFSPEPWSIGPRSQEPVDLVWATNHVVLLISMKSGKQASKSAGQEKSLDQLRGCLRLWKDGRRLKGANAVAQFDLAYDDSAHVVMLSLLGADHVPVTVDRDEAARLGVALVASIPEHLLHRLAWRHGGSRDLVDLVLQADRPGGLAGSDAITVLDELHRFRYTHTPFGQQPLNRTDPLSQRIVQLLAGYRHPSLGRPGTRLWTAPAAMNPAGTLDDLGWNGFFTVLGAVHDPVAPRLFRPYGPDTFSRMAGDAQALFKLLHEAGAPVVIPSTYAPPPQDVSPWPPEFLSAVDVHRIENHTIVTARVASTRDAGFQQRWRAAWAEATSIAESDTPPLGMVLHLDRQGVAFIFCGFEGNRASATHRVITQHLSSD